MVCKFTPAEQWLAYGMEGSAFINLFVFSYPVDSINE